MFPEFQLKRTAYSVPVTAALLVESQNLSGPVVIYRHFSAHFFDFFVMADELRSRGSCLSWLCGAARIRGLDASDPLISTGKPNSTTSYS